MAFSPETNGATEQMEGREVKRRRSAPSPLDLHVAMGLKPETNIDVIEDGDVLLVVSKLNGEEKPIGLRCSSFALSIASPVFKASLAAPVALPAPATDSSTTSNLDKGRIIQLPEDDGDALLLILYIIHFRHDNLPACISADMLFRIGMQANKHGFSTAISRSTTQWFDRIFTEMLESNNKNPTETMAMIQAALLCDEPMYFARFTGRYACTTAFAGSKAPATEQETEQTQRLKRSLLQRQAEGFAAVRLDLDLLIDPCAIALGKESDHYIDCPPDTEPDPSELPLGSDGQPGKAPFCPVDSQAAPLYLGALRDAGLWPPSAWDGRTLEQLSEAVAEFRVPEYDDSDKCEFCIPLVETFELKLKLVRKIQRERLWGLCLDCFLKGGVNAGECRYSHVKVGKTRG